MSSPLRTFHTAQEAALRASAALLTAMGGTRRIYTNVPADIAPPYVVIGDDQWIPEDNECADHGQIFATVHVWSRTEALDKGAQARAMGSAIIDDLNVALSLTGWDIDNWEVQSESYATDPDGSTHGIILFRYELTEQVT